MNEKLLKKVEAFYRLATFYPPQNAPDWIKNLKQNDLISVETNLGSAQAKFYSWTTGEVQDNEFEFGGHDSVKARVIFLSPPEVVTEIGGGPNHITDVEWNKILRKN